MGESILHHSGLWLQWRIWWSRFYTLRCLSCSLSVSMENCYWQYWKSWVEALTIDKHTGLLIILLQRSDLDLVFHRICEVRGCWPLKEKGWQLGQHNGKIYSYSFGQSLNLTWKIYPNHHIWTLSSSVWKSDIPAGFDCLLSPQHFFYSARHKVTTPYAAFRVGDFGAFTHFVRHQGSR